MFLPIFVYRTMVEHLDCRKKLSKKFYFHLKQCVTGSRCVIFKFQTGKNVKTLQRYTYGIQK